MRRQWAEDERRAGAVGTFCKGSAPTACALRSTAPTVDVGAQVHARRVRVGGRRWQREHGVVTTVIGIIRLWERRGLDVA